MKRSKRGSECVLSRKVGSQSAVGGEVDRRSVEVELCLGTNPVEGRRSVEAKVKTYDDRRGQTVALGSTVGTHRFIFNSTKNI